MNLITNQSSREDVLLSVKDEGLMLEYASAELKNDREIVLEAINTDPEAIEYASDELKNDSEILEILE